MQLYFEMFYRLDVYKLRKAKLFFHLGEKCCLCLTAIEPRTFLSRIFYQSHDKIVDSKYGEVQNQLI